MWILLIQEDDEEYFSVSKSIVYDMVVKLIDRGIERVLYELYQRKNLGHLTDEIKRIIAVIVTYKKQNE